MTDINYFEYAIKAKETNDLFRGAGKYFISSQDYEGHVHGAHMGGCINTFVSASNENSEKFKTAFIDFLYDLKVSNDDINNLLANLSSYFAQKQRGNLANTNLFSGKNPEETELLKKYITTVMQSDLSPQIEEKLIRHANFLENKGSSLLKDIIKGQLRP